MLSTTSKNDGKTEDLNGFMYDVGSNTQDQMFTDTTREISEYADWTLKESQDIRRAIENLTKTYFKLTVKTNTGDMSINNTIFNR